jgi:hypothetical protein
VNIESNVERNDIGKRLLAELEDVPPDILPPDEREFAAFAWAVGAAQRGYTTIEQILADRTLKACILDDFDDEAADKRLPSLGHPLRRL